MRNALLRTFGWFAALPYVIVLFLVVTGPATWSGILYVLAMGAMVFGLATLPRLDEDGNPLPTKRKRPRGITRAGFALIAVVAFIRCFTASRGETMAMPEGGGGSARFASRLVDESDVAVAGTRVLVGSGALRDDAAELPSAMSKAYSDMKREEGDLPSPVLTTYLGMQHPSGFDVLLVEPPATASHDTAVIFLHGFAGNFDLPCWQVARAAQVLTACPSTRWVGDWWTSEGHATLERTIEIVRARGARHIVLIGLSNGGYGASKLAPRVRGKIDGLVLISGADADAPAPGVPTLVIHGVSDNHAPVSEARGYAQKHGARFVGLEAGHFAMLVRKEETDRAVRSFVAGFGRPKVTASR
jgi:predicted alpha/beta hydrolase family esterase